MCVCVREIEKRERPVSLLSLLSPSSPCLFLMWTFLLPDWEKVFPQIPQWWGFSPGGEHRHKTHSHYTGRIPSKKNRKAREDILYPITNKTNAQVCSCELNSPECTSMCFRRLEYSAKDRPQPSASHRKGFSPGSGHPPRTRTHTYGWTSQHKRLESRKTCYWTWFEHSGSGDCGFYFVVVFWSGAVPLWWKWVQKKI